MTYDRDFLLQLDKTKNKIIYARITALTFDELPIETIEGRITQGSINVDGASAVRRTCSLTMIAENFNYQNYYWGLNTKFKLEIGVENFINPMYPNIIWFKQGIYLFTSFNTSHSTNNFTISLSGKDKMCLLNGEVGGSLESQVDFGTIEEETQDGVWSIRKIPIKEIILNAVHVYANEPYHNIIIDGLDEEGLELLEYRYDVPMYLYRPINSNNFINMTLDGTVKCYVDGKEKKLNELTYEELDPLITTLTNTTDVKPVKINGKDYYIAKIEFGQAAGYKMTELTYAGDLIGNVGESVISVLDKIRNMLTEYEYFYNVDGQFVFQKKQSFENTIWSPIKNALTEEDGEIITDKYVEAMTSATAYSFNDGELISAFSNNPNILNMRNDYAIWGVRKSLSGGDIPIHMRYAIDKKPIQYISITVNDEELSEYNQMYGTKLKGQESKIYNNNDWDWREIIYQMAKDFNKYSQFDFFTSRVAQSNPDKKIGYPTGYTGYEKYYTDLLGFWRDLYYPTLQFEINEHTTEIESLTRQLENGNLSEKERIDIEYDINNLNEQLKEKESKISNYYEEAEFHAFWNKNVYEAPYLLNFWFDFLDSQGELSQFNTKIVGFRTKAVNDNNIKSIYFRETPDVIFYDSAKRIDTSNSSYKYIQIPNIEEMFSISAQGKSAKDRLDELIYQHGYCIENATITTIPIYYLQPNTRIHLSDSKAGLDGDYIVSKITVPLAYNGTMQITATKAAERII